MNPKCVPCEHEQIIFGLLNELHDIFSQISWFFFSVIIKTTVLFHSIHLGNLIIKQKLLILALILSASCLQNEVLCLFTCDSCDQVPFEHNVWYLIQHLYLDYVVLASFLAALTQKQLSVAKTSIKWLWLSCEGSNIIRCQGNTILHGGYASFRV